MPRGEQGPGPPCLLVGASGVVVGGGRVAEVGELDLCLSGQSAIESDPRPVVLSVGALARRGVAQGEPLLPFLGCSVGLLGEPEPVQGSGPERVEGAELGESPQPSRFPLGCRQESLGLLRPLPVVGDGGCVPQSVDSVLSPQPGDCGVQLGGSLGGSAGGA